jgi:hypothetical protein
MKESCIFFLFQNMQHEYYEIYMASRHHKIVHFIITAARSCWLPSNGVNCSKRQSCKIRVPNCNSRRPFQQIFIFSFPYKQRWVEGTGIDFLIGLLWMCRGKEKTNFSFSCNATMTVTANVCYRLSWQTWTAWHLLQPGISLGKNCRFLYFLSHC